MPLYTLFIRHLLGWVLLSAGIEKMLHRSKFESLAAGLGFRGTRAASIVVPAVEVALGALLLAGAWWRAAALASGILFLIFAAVIVRLVRRGYTGECGCGGILAASHVGRLHLLGVAVLAVAAMLLAAANTTVWAINTPDLAVLSSDVDDGGLEYAVPALLVINLLLAQRVGEQLRRVRRLQSFFPS